MKIKKHNRFLPYGRQVINQDDINSVLEVLEHDYITQGPRIQEFETRFANYVGSKHAVACFNGTAALHMACQAIGLRKGDKLVTSPITFLASANCAQFVGADTTFVDINIDDYTISVKELEKFLDKENVDVVVPVHYAGQSAKMKQIYELKKKYNYYIIEDACHALGGRYLNSKIGSCMYSDLSIFSFHPVKHITTGEGGVVTTNDKVYYEKLLLYRNHGIHKKTELFKNNTMAFDEDGNQNIWYYEMEELGHNYRITDIQCGLGLSQLKKIDQFVERRREIASMYNDGFNDNEYIKIPRVVSGVKHSYHLYPIQIDFVSLGENRNTIMKRLIKMNVGSQVLYIPVHLQPYYSNKYGFKYGDYPNSEKFYENCLSIPMFPSLTDSEVKYIISVVNSIVS